MTRWRFSRRSALLFACACFAILAVNQLPPIYGGNSPTDGILPTCLQYDAEEIPPFESVWLAIPDDARDMNTRVPYVFLAGKLIMNDVVNADTCPDGGLLENGSANACGLERAVDIVYQMQNWYDDEILNAWARNGVPPQMLKNVFRFESQFWAGKYGELHYGLGHLTPNGASTSLLWNIELYQQMCNVAFGTACFNPYIQQSNPAADALVATTLGFVNADCDNCEFGIMVPRAEDSVDLFAKSMLAHCTQASQVIYNLTGLHSSESTDFVNIWKFTLFNYNVGVDCLYVSIDNAVKDGYDNFTWDLIEDYVPRNRCLQGIDYVERITNPNGIPPDQVDDN